MGDLAALDGANLTTVQSNDSDCFAIERNKLNLESGAISVNVQHRPHITDCEMFAGKVGHEDYSVVLGNQVHDRQPTKGVQ